MSWLIDGQQRVITLSRAISGDEGIEIVFHPEDEEFQLANAATRRDGNWFRVADLWDEELYRSIRRNLVGPRGDQREAKFERVRQILDYEVPAVQMLDHTFEHAVDAFTRINTLGVKLKKEDIESAHVAAKHSGFIADEVAPFLQQIRQEGFDRLNVMHLFRACAFMARPDGRMRTPLHELERREVESAWNATKRATEDAIGVIKSELGLLNMDILWSGALIVPVIALCAVMTGKRRDTRGMIAWLSLAALYHRYSKSTESALDQDLRACRSEDPIGALLTNVRKVEKGLNALPSDFEGALMDKGGLLGAFVACHQRGLRDLFSGGKVLLQKRVERHHILPRAQFVESRRAEADTIANIAFVTESANRTISNSGPEVYLQDIESTTLKSQCIPSDESLWRVDRAVDFWKARRELLAEAFNDFLRGALPGRRI